MDTKASFYIAIIGIDGSGKSSCFEGLLDTLSQNKSVAGIGDKVLVSDNKGKLSVPKDILRVQFKSALGILVKMCKSKFTYEISKLTELVSRSKIHDTILKRYKPEYVITDGSPLINILAWGRYYHPEHFNEKECLNATSYLAGRKKISSNEASYFLKHIPELILINRIYRARLKIPDVIIFLKIDPEEALERIRSRGKEIQVHERKDFLNRLQEAYVFVCKMMRQEFAVKVFEIDVSALTKNETLRRCQELIKPQDTVEKINVVATTISGSIKDWKKLDNMELQFKRYDESVKVHIVDSHREAFRTTKEIINKGGRIIVSAGGAGTFNSVLEGCCAYGCLPVDLRIAFLRKGSADLIGKVLKIPDELADAVKIISEGVKQDNTIESDVLEIIAQDQNGQINKFHMIGFSGVGVFGDIPYFTESRFIKYYKGILGYLFGDRGPFLTGANLAMAKRYLDKAKGKRIKFRIIADGQDIPYKNYISIIVMNGDLGRDFPIAKGIPLGSGDFQVTLMEDRGLVNAYKQMIHAWKGDLADYKEKLGVNVFRTKNLQILPNFDSQYFLNVDGLLKRVSGKIEYRLFSKVRLITG